MIPCYHSCCRPKTLNLSEEPSEFELEVSHLNLEIKDLQEKLQKARDTLSDHLKSKNMAMKLEGEEILPWHFKLTAVQEEYLSRPDILGHVKVFRSLLTGYAVCVDISSNNWLWYEWTQRLWVLTNGMEILPLFIKIISEKERIGVKINVVLTRNTLQLHDIVSNLKTRLVDYGDIQYKLNRNENLASLENGKVIELDTYKVRLRIREDYLSSFISKGKIISQAGIELPLRIAKQNEDLESFYRGVIVPNTNKNKTVTGILSSQLHSIYEEWCNSRFLESQSRKTLITFLESKGFDRKRLSDGYHWLGIDGPFL